MVFSCRFEAVDKFSTGIACSRGCSAAAELLVYYIFNLNQMAVLNVYSFTIKNFVFIVYIIFMLFCFTTRNFVHVHTLERNVLFSCLILNLVYFVFSTNHYCPSSPDVPLIILVRVTIHNSSMHSSWNLAVVAFALTFLLTFSVICTCRNSRTLCTYP